MQDELLTEAARRAIQTAITLAARNGSPECEPLHLLRALILEESHAAEALNRAGVDRQGLADIAALDAPDAAGPACRAGPLSADKNRSLPAEGTDTGDGGASAVSQSDAVRRIVASAVQAASLRGRQSQVGTDDLLLALVSVDSAASHFLARRGVTAATLGPDEAHGGGKPSEPIAVDFNIRWRDATEEDRTQTLRIVDAAANRAREGLRVLEDYARFALDDGHLTGRLKDCRHALREALRDLPAAGLLRCRETQADVGTAITTQSETVRQSPVDVAVAAFKRAEEAVRSLEEFGKLWSVSAAGKLKALRYELYTLEKALLSTEFNRRELVNRRLYLLVTQSLCPRGCGPAVQGALAGRVDLVQLREKNLPDRRLIELGTQVRRWTREAGAIYIMNDRADLAVATDADGLHIGQEELSVKEARTIVGPHRLVGVSTHTLHQARQAVLDGADYIGVGPVFASQTKSFASLPGLELVRQVAAEIALPWFAIGGINAGNVEQVLAAGAQRIAVSHAILSAEDAEYAARDLSERIRHRAD